MTFLEYAVNPSGEYVHISQSPRGRVDLSCPYCGRGLLAKKGRALAHHFAHDGDTCRDAERDFDRLTVPAWDRFNLHIPADLWGELQRFHAGRGHNTRALMDADLIRERWGRARGYELTLTGKIPFGESSLESFAEFQISAVIERHNDLSETVEQAYYGVESWGRIIHEPRPAEAQTALIDLNIYRAQVRRLYTMSLYLLEITTSTGEPLYKIGVTVRAVEHRIEEVRRDLRDHVTVDAIQPLRVLVGRGAIERYALHRYTEHRAQVGKLTEYLHLDKATRRKLLSDLTRMGDRPHDDPDHPLYNHPDFVSIINGEPSAIERRIKDDQRHQAHSTATKTGMAQARASGIHVGRPADDDDETLAKYPAVIDALEQGLSLRKTAEAAGVSVNTVRKVKAIMDSRAGD